MRHFTKSRGTTSGSGGGESRGEPRPTENLALIQGVGGGLVGQETVFHASCLRLAPPGGGRGVNHAGRNRGKSSKQIRSILAGRRK